MASSASDVEARPFHAWIDAWEMRGFDATSDRTIAPLQLPAAAETFSYDLKLDATQPLVPSGAQWLQRKIGPWPGLVLLQPALFQRSRTITIDDKPVQVTDGLDGSGVEQSAARARSDRMGLVLPPSRRRRQADALPIAPDERPASSGRQLDCGRW